MFLPHWPKTIFKDKTKNRLELLEKALHSLGSPQKKINNVIHIAGTNGKGSTANFIQKILLESGKKVNLFTSPHLLHYNECFYINGEKISDRELNSIIETVRSKLGENFEITLFEASFLFAVLAFKNNKADYNVFETGLGGRIDPTNLLENKDFSLFTPISLDHQEFLGPNIETITLEKAYIIKENSCVITAPQPHISLGILKEFSSAYMCKIICYEENYDFYTEDGHFYFVDIMEEKIYEFSFPALIGSHQLTNLATSLACLKEIINFDQHQQNIEHAITNIKFSNRLQIMPHPKLKENGFQNCEIWCDGAHNPSGAKAISSWLVEQEKKYTFLLYGRTSAKNHHDFLNEFTDSVDEIVFFEINNEPSPCRKREFLDFLNKKTINTTIHIEDSLVDAIHYCFNHHTLPFRIIMCGSLYIFRDYQKIF